MDAHRWLCRQAYRWALLLAVAGASATPLTQWPLASGNTAAGQARFGTQGQATTINVYVQNDPTAGGTRHETVADGIRRWSTELGDRQVTIAVHFNATGRAPAGATNPVEVVFAARTDLTNANDAEARPRPSTQTQTLVSGRRATVVTGMRSTEIRVANDLTNTALLANLGMHEFGHAMGLNEEPQPAAPGPGRPHDVMDHHVPDTGVMQFSARDIAELDQMYGRPQSTTVPQRPRAQMSTPVVTPLGGGAYRYDYEIAWVDGPATSLFQLLLGAGATIFDTDFGGWQPWLPLETDAVMADAVGYGSPDFEVLSLINPDAPLGPDHPSAHFAFSSLQAPDLSLAYGGTVGSTGSDEYFVVVAPAAVSTPSTLALLGAALCAGWASRRRGGLRGQS